MNIKDLPQGSYQEVQSPKLNINSLPSGSYQEQLNSLPSTSTSEPNFIDKVGEFSSQAGRSIFKTVDTISSLGQKTFGRLVGANKPGQETSKLPEGLTRSGETPTENAGGIFGEAIQYLTPMGAETATTKGITVLGKILEKSPSIIKGLGKLGVKSLVGGTEFAGKTALMGGSKEDVKSAGVFGAATPPALKVAGRAGKFVFGDVAPAILGSMTGIDPKTIKAAFSNWEEVAKYMSEKVIPLDVRTNAIKALGSFRKSVSKEFGEGLDNLAQTSMRSKPARTLALPGTPGVFSGVKGRFKDMLNSGTDNVKGTLNQFRISINGSKLNFNKLNSSIVSPTEQKQIQNVWDTLNNQKDFSARGVQDVAARINALSKYVEGAKTQTSAVISKMHNVYDKAIQKVYPQLGKLRKEFGASQQIISGIDDILKSTKNDIANPNVSTSVAKKLTNLFNEDNEAYVRALKKLEEKTGIDLINQFVAANFDKVLPGKLGSVIGQAGILAGGAFYNPLLLTVLPLFSPKLVGNLVTGAGKVANTARKVSPLLPNILK